MQNNADAPTSRVMLLLNMVTPEELYNDDDYNDIIEDINDECSKYGEIEGVRIPRPVPKSKKWESTEAAAATAERNKRTDDEAGVGRVYVMYKDVESTKKAMNAIGGRQFAGRTILVANVPEVSLAVSFGRLDFIIANFYNRKSSWVQLHLPHLLKMLLHLRKAMLPLRRLLPTWTLPQMLLLKILCLGFNGHRSIPLEKEPLYATIQILMHSMILVILSKIS